MLSSIAGFSSILLEASLVVDKIPAVLRWREWTEKEVNPETTPNRQSDNNAEADFRMLRLCVCVWITAFLALVFCHPLVAKGAKVMDRIEKMPGGCQGSYQLMIGEILSPGEAKRQARVQQQRL